MVLGAQLRATSIGGVAGVACGRARHGGKCTHGRANGGGGRGVERRGERGEGQEKGILLHQWLSTLTGTCATVDYAHWAHVLALRPKHPGG